MSDDIKKLLSIMNETTTSGAVAPVAGGMGKSMLKRPVDSIFAAEGVPQDADTGLEAAPKVDSPANFGLWKNSAVIGKKKNKLREGTEREQEVIDSTRSSRQDAERNAGLNEPDELSMPGKEVDVGTWYFTVDGVPQKKDGEVYYSSSKEHNEHVLAHLRKRAEERGDLGVAIEVIQGPVKSSNSRQLPVDMDDWTEDDWAEWDAKVNAVGKKAKEQDGKKLVRDRKTGKMYDPDVEFEKKMNSPEVMAQMRRMATKEDVAEGLEQPREAGKAIQNLKNLALMKSALTMQQLSQAGRGSIVTNAIKAAKTLEQAYLQNRQQGNAVFIRSLTDEIDNFMKGYPINSSMSQDTTPELGDLLQGKLRNVNFETKKLDEYSEWDGTGEQDMAAAIASDGIDSQDAQTEKQISLSEAEITEEMIADRLKGELALLKKGQKKDNSIAKKPADKEVHTNEQKKESAKPVAKKTESKKPEGKK